MHQSISAVAIHPPPPPPAPSPGWASAGAFAHVVSPGGVAFPILPRPGGWAFAYPGLTSGHLTHMFSKKPWKSLLGKTRRLSNNGSSITGLEKLVDVFKGTFTHYNVFLHFLKK